jgi:hypothetical protein
VHADEVHLRLVVGVERADVAPVAVITLRLARDVVVQEVVDGGVAGVDEHGDDVAPHVVRAVRVLGVGLDRLLEGPPA